MTDSAHTSPIIVEAAALIAQRVKEGLFRGGCGKSPVKQPNPLPADWVQPTEDKYLVACLARPAKALVNFLTALKEGKVRRNDGQAIGFYTQGRNGDRYVGSEARQALLSALACEFRRVNPEAYAAIINSDPIILEVTYKENRTAIAAVADPQF